jgi:hypothetical protein
VLALLAIVTIRMDTMTVTALALLAGAVAVSVVLRRFSRRSAA